MCPEITGSKNAYEVEHVQIIVAMFETIVKLSMQQDAFVIKTFKLVNKIKTCH